MTDLDTSGRDDTGETGVATAPPPPEKDRLGASYYKLFTGTVVSNLGDGMGTVAYPWLASAITRNPLLVALVAVTQRLPWLVFTLPAGVITDRVDRRKAMLWMDVLRGTLTVGVAIAVLGSQDVLPGPDEVGTVIGTRWGLLVLVLVATLLLGMAEVLRDNANQTIIPNIVRPDQLEKANGRIWGVEAVTNTFAGPPLGSILLVVAFSLPFFVHASTFFVAAAMVALIPGTFRAPRAPDQPKQTFRAELGEGVRWLMGHQLLRPMAIILGLMNGAGMIAFATFVLFAQEVMEVGPFLFTVIGFGGAIGGLLGGNVAPWVTRRVGSGTALAISIGGLAIVPFLVGAIAWWPAVLVLFGFEAFFGILWNVITVSLRQTIIPEGLLGRVNSVYRFFAWGMIPIGSAIGGVWVWVMERQVDREFALRSTWFLVGAIHVALFLFGRAKLTTDKIEAARAAATTPSAS
jgi:predicted MFS family arabinose efflux permease